MPPWSYVNESCVSGPAHVTVTLPADDVLGTPPETELTAWYGEAAVPLPVICDPRTPENPGVLMTIRSWKAELSQSMSAMVKDTFVTGELNEKAMVCAVVDVALGQVSASPCPAGIPPTLPVVSVEFLGAPVAPVFV